MLERWRIGYIALTAIVVTLAMASAILSATGPKPPQSEALYTHRATPTPSPTRRITLQSPTSTPAAPTSTPLPTDTPSPSPSPTSTPVPTHTPSPTFASYEVKAGETMYEIAHAFGVTLKALLAANPDITDAGKVRAGQIILIPPPGWAPSPSP